MQAYTQQQNEDHEDRRHLSLILKKDQQKERRKSLGSKALPWRPAGSKPKASLDKALLPPEPGTAEAELFPPFLIKNSPGTGGDRHHDGQSPSPAGDRPQVPRRRTVDTSSLLSTGDHDPHSRFPQHSSITPSLAQDGPHTGSGGRNPPGLDGCGRGRPAHGLLEQLRQCQRRLEAAQHSADDLLHPPAAAQQLASNVEDYSAAPAPAQQLQVPCGTAQGAPAMQAGPAASKEANFGPRPAEHLAAASPRMQVCRRASRAKRQQGPLHASKRGGPPARPGPSTPTTRASQARPKGTPVRAARAVVHVRVPTSVANAAAGARAATGYSVLFAARLAQGRAATAALPGPDHANDCGGGATAAHGSQAGRHDAAQPCLLTDLSAAGAISSGVRLAQHVGVAGPAHAAQPGGPRPGGERGGARAAHTHHMGKVPFLAKVLDGVAKPGGVVGAGRCRRPVHHHVPQAAASKPVRAHVFAFLTVVCKSSVEYAIEM